MHALRELELELEGLGVEDGKLAVVSAVRPSSPPPPVRVRTPVQWIDSSRSGRIVVDLSDDEVLPRGR